MKIKTKRKIKLTSLFVAVGIVLGSVAIAVFDTRQASAACSVPNTSFGQSTSTISVGSAGTYRIWSRIMAPDSANNSYSLEIDGGTCYTVGDSAIAANTWTWVDYQNGTAASKISLNLSAGSHTFKLIGREANVKVDRVLALTDTACIPSGMGGNCSTNADTTAPTVNLTAPAANSTVTGTTAINANAIDETGISKVEFYIDNALKGSDSTAPYTYSWDSKQVTNGSHSVSAKAYDAAGNTGSDVRTVNVTNGDTQAPSVPGGLKVTADAANKVTLSWNASTDNTAVVGYTVLRNGAALNTSSTTSYTDTTAAPNTTYTYQIKAYDAAGNSSAATSNVSVKTPIAADTQAPSVPQNVRANAVNTSQINLAWTASTDNIAVTAYDIYRASTGGATTKVGSSTTTTFGDTNLKANTTYTYHVIARDSNSNASAKSATASAKTAEEQTIPAPTPEDPQGTAVIRGKVTGNRGRALPGTKVTMWSDGKRYYATTNGNGVYRFDNLPAGRYSVTYKTDGYQKEEETLRARENRQTVNNIRLYENNRRPSWWNRWWQ
jgi:chitodextrinase